MDTYVLTLVASDRNRPLCAGDVADACVLLGLSAGVFSQAALEWLSPDKAADFPFESEISDADIFGLRDAFFDSAIDVFVTPRRDRRKRLLVADMDSTIVRGETLDDVAARAGVGARVAGITLRAMDGDMDFSAALIARVALLEGLETAVLAEVRSAIVLNPGARTLVRTMAASGAFTALVTGGFTWFSRDVAQRAGFHTHHANALAIQDDRLTGGLCPPILAPDSKKAILLQHAATQGISPAQALAIGDGANDIPMIGIAGLGIGYHPKPVLAAATPHVIVHGDLEVALYAQGYKDSEFVREGDSDSGCAPVCV